jgi:hypothetical protein
MRLVRQYYHPVGTARQMGPRRDDPRVPLVLIPPAE